MQRRGSSTNQSPTVSELLGYATKLPARDLRKLRLAIEQLSGVSKQVERFNDIGPEATFAYEAIAARLDTYHKINPPPLSRLKDSRYLRVIYRGLETTTAFVEVHWPDSGRASRHRLYDYLTDMAVRVARRQGRPPKLVTIMSILTNAPAMFDQQLPGYLHAGLAALITDRLAAVKHRNRVRIHAA